MQTTAHLKTREKGKSKKGTIEDLVGLNILAEENSELPLMFKIVPGNQHDVTDFVYFLERVQFYSKN